MVLITLLIGCDAAGPVATADAPETAIVDRPVVERPSTEKPVIWSASVAPATTRPGSRVVLTIQARLAIGWSIQSVGDARGPVVPTSLAIDLPPGVEAIGDWELPNARRPIDKPGSGPVYEGDVAFRRTLRVADDQSPQAVEIGCDIRSQACNAELCRRPEDVTLATMLTISD